MMNNSNEMNSGSEEDYVKPGLVKVAESVFFGVPLFFYPEYVKQKLKNQKYVYSYTSYEGKEILLLGKMVSRNANKDNFQVFVGDHYVSGGVHFSFKDEEQVALKKEIKEHYESLGNSEILEIFNMLGIWNLNALDEYEAIAA